jgi:PAS domain S-box-containing protein
MFPDIRIRQRDQLLEIARAISQELEPERALEKVLRYAVEMLGGEAGFIILPQPSSWRIAASVGVAPEFLRTVEPVMANIPTGTDPVAEIQRRLSRLTQAHSMGLLSSLGLPLTVRGAVTGAVFVLRAGRARFTANERALLQSFADQAAVAVANARLFAQVREEKQRLDAILESSAEGIAILGSDNRIQRFNRAMVRMTGIPLEQATGRPQEDVLRMQPVRQGHTLAEAEAGGWPLSNGAALFLEGDLMRRDGSKLPVGITYAPVFSQERNLLNIILEMRDLTRYQEAEQLKDTFISIISHELKTPVALIKGYVGTLRREDADWDRAVVQDSLAVIEEEADRLTGLIEDLLDASRLQAGGLAPRMAEVRLPDVARRWTERFARQQPERVIDVVFPEDFPVVQADEERIGQVLSNLLSNAIKYSPSGSRVEVRGRVLPEEVVVTVSDNGYGIAQADVPHVFERFYRAEDTARRTKGAGLGLYLAKAIVEAHGGRIWVDAASGPGTRLSFSIPRPTG